MAKKAVAVTNIKGSDVEVTAGEEVDLSKFSKDELKELHANGAIELVENKDEAAKDEQASQGSEDSEPVGPETKVNETGEPTPATPVKATSAPVTTPAKAAPAPAKATSPEVKK